MNKLNILKEDIVVSHKGELLKPRRNLEVGKCYYETNDESHLYGNHYYLVRNNDILHVNTMGIINTISMPYVKEDSDLKEVPKRKFIAALNKALYELDLLQYLKP